MAAITLNIGGNTRQLDRDIQKTVNKVYNINLKSKGDQPLGRITGKVNEFNKSLDASNARVIAFGASAGIIFGVERAFTALVSSTIEVQKSLQDINVILNVSAQSLQKFGGELFNIARNTGQSFQEVAKAATEFSRQGLGVEETLKRTNEALILSRLSGLDAAKSVESLTAAVNSFASQAVTATEVVNKFATVDAAFAVSSADLADAIARVGSSAAQSGVSLNELIAIVTSAQQTTARGGAVIGNSFKTIFTRLQREKVVDLLESLGISGTDASGQVKSTIQLLQDLGAVYDTLGSQQQAYVAEQVGGVFQINILKAALADLGKEYSIYSSALNVAAGATDQAIRRNEELNKTYSAQINALAENARQLAAAGGERLLGPSIDRLVGGTNTLLEGFSESDGQNVGAVLGKGILDGLGQFIAGPGLALIGGVLLKLFRDLAKFATGSVQQLLGLNTAATQQRDLQQSINSILAKNPQLLQLALQGEQGLNQAANSLLASLQKQTVELQKQAVVAQQISKAFVAQAGVRVAGGVPVVPTPKPGRAGKAAGYIPNFASDKLIEKYTAISLGATSSVRPHMSQGTIGGKKFVMNNQEVEFPGVGKNGDSMVLPTYGDGPRIAASGFIPNFVKKSSTNITEEPPKNVGQIDLNKYLPNAESRYGVLYPVGGSSSKAFSQNLSDMAVFKDLKLAGRAIVKLPFKSIYPIDNKEIGDASTLFNKATDTYLSQGMTNLAGEIGRAIQVQAGGQIEASSPNRVSADSLPQGAKGSIFEAATKAATRDLKVTAKERSNEFFDFDPIGAYPALASLFGFTALKSAAVEAKIGDQAAKNIPNKVLNQNPAIRNKILKDLKLETSKKQQSKVTTTEAAKKITGFKKLTPEEEAVLKKIPKSIPLNKAFGYIPNFAAQQIAEVMALETAMSGEKAIFDTKPFPHVRNKSQPTFGSAMADHGGKNKALKDSLMGQKRAGIRSSGFIPNFAIEDPDVQAGNLGSSLAALGAQVTAVGFAFQFSKDEYKQALDQFQKDNNKAAKGVQKLGIAAQSNALALSIAAPIIGETLKNAFGQESKTGRVAGAAASGLGQVSSFAATGALIAGPGPQALLGAGIGAAVGALLTVPDIIQNAFTDFPELAREAQKAQQSLTQFGDSSSRLIQAYESYKTVLETGNASAEQLSKVQKSLAEALSSVPQEYRQELTNAIGTGDLTGAIARRNEIIAKEVTIKAGIANIEKTTGEAKSADVLSGIGNTLFNAISGPIGLINQGIGIANSATGSNLPTVGSYFLGSSGQTLGSEENVESLKQIFKTALTGDEQLSRENVEKISNIQIDTSSIENLKRSLKSVTTVDKEGKVKQKFTDQQIASILKQAETNFTVTAQNVQDATNFVKEDFKSLVENQLKARERLTEYNAAMAESRKKIDATISSLQKNIEVQNLFKKAFDNTAEGLRSLAADINIARQFTQPAEALGQVIGTDKTPTRKLQAQSDIALIQEQQRSAISGFGIEFKDTIRGILQKPFQENAAKISENLNAQNSKVDPENITGSINTITDNLISQSMGEYQNLTSVMESVENYMAQFVNRQISTQQLLEQSKNELSKVGIDVTKGSQASDAIEKAVAELEVKSIQEQVKAFQQRAKLANETKQAILQSRIEQALNTFGGFEGFMNRPEEEGNYIQRISPDLQKIEQIRSSTAFRYNNKDSIKEQEKQAPELGRSLTNVYKELIDQSGGAFRDFLQKEADTILNATGSEGRSELAGAGGGGGFRDVIRGREVDLENQLKLAEDELKITTDPLAKRILEGFISSIKSAPAGLKGVAALQTQKELGVANQSSFAKIYGKYENESLNRLKDISPELAASLESAISLSDDPLVAEAQLQSALQTDMVGYLSPIQSALLQIANSGGASVTQTGVPKIEGYAPKLTEEQQKKADEFRKKQEEVAKKEADIKAKKAQEAAMPKDNRTIAEIEAETRNKRDQKYFQAQLSPTNRSTGKRFESIEEVDAEMQKALALSAFNPDQKAYYTTLKNFKEKLNPTGGRSERGQMFMSYEKDMTFDPNSPSEIEKRTIAARDQRLAGIINPQQILGPNLGLGPNVAVGQEDLQNQIGSQIKPLSDIGTSLRPLSEISNDVNRASYDMDVKRKGLYEGNIGAELERRKLAENPLLTLTPQQVTTQGPQALEQSFTQQEAAFSNNTSALTTLATSIENLNSTITNTQSTNGNVNSPISQQAGAQPQVSTNTNAPVSVVVNAQGGTDISTAVGQAVQNAIPSIVEKVRIAMGEKVPPTVSRPPLTTNPKFGAGQRADGGFLL